MLKTLFYICLVTLSLGQFSAIYKSGDSNLYLFDLAVAGFAFIGFIYFLLKKSFYIPKPMLPFLFFTFVAIVSIILRIQTLKTSEFLVSLFYLFRWISYLTAALVILNMFKSNLISKEEILRAFVYSGIFISLAGFIQLILLPDFTVLDSSLGWDPHKNRLASTFFDPNFTGAYLILSIIALMSWLGAKKESLKSFKFIYFFVILVLALFLTFSRSSWVMFAVVILIYGLFRYRFLLFLSLLIAFSAYFFVPRVQTRIAGATDPADSAHFRVISWGNTFTIARDHLLTGVGFNAFRYAQNDYGFLNPDTIESHSGSGSDSSFLFILATTGIFGFISFALGYFIVSISKGDYRLPAFAVYSGLFLHSQFVNSLFYPQILFFWLILAVIFNYSFRN